MTRVQGDTDLTAGGPEKWSVTRGEAIIFSRPPESRGSNIILVTGGFSHYLFHYTSIMVIFC